MWSRIGSGELVERFPATEEGFEQAERLFDRLTREGREKRAAWRPWLRWATLGAILAWITFGSIVSGVFALGIQVDADLAGVLQLVDTTTFRVGIGGLAALLALWLMSPAPAHVARARRGAPLRTIALLLIAAGALLWLVGGAYFALNPDLTGVRYGSFGAEAPSDLSRLMLLADAVGFRLLVAGAALLLAWWSVAPPSETLADGGTVTGGSS